MTKINLKNTVRVITLLSGLVFVSANALAMGGGVVRNPPAPAPAPAVAPAAPAPAAAPTGAARSRSPDPTRSQPPTPKKETVTADLGVRTGPDDPRCIEDRKKAETDGSCLLMMNKKESSTVENGQTVTKWVCAWDDTAAQAKYKNVANACQRDIGQCQTERCVQALNNAGLGPCDVQYVEAKKSFDDFKTACVDTNLGSAEQCLEEARQCTLGWQAENETSDEDTEDGDSNVSLNAVWKMLGLGDGTDKKDESKALQCSTLGAKDWGTEKRDISTQLRAAQKEMADLTKDLSNDEDAASDKKKELMIDFNKAKTDADEKRTETQKAASQEGMEAQESIMGIEDKKAGLRSQILQNYGKKSEIIGARALALAELSDAMIATNCMTALEVEAKKMSGGLTRGFSTYWGTFAEKRRRLKGMKEACYAKAETTRITTYRKFNSDLQVLTDEIADLNRKIAALDLQSQSIATEKATAISKAVENEKAIAADQTKTQQAIYERMVELDTSKKKRADAAVESTKAAQARISDLTSDMRGLGKKPKGSKTPTEAASKFTTFVGKMSALDNPECKARYDELIKNVESDKITKYFKNGVTFSDEDEEMDDTPSDKPAIK